MSYLAEAMKKELARGRSGYYLHNRGGQHRVHRSPFSQLVPGARVGIAAQAR